MRRNLLLLLVPTLLLLWGASVPAQRQQADIAAYALSPAPYRVGERLTYNISFSQFPTAAFVELRVAGRGQLFGREGIELRAHVETTEAVGAALLSLNNDYIAYVDPQTGLPYRTQQVIREGLRAAEGALDYNQPLGTDAFPNRVTAGEFPGTYDFLSALYRLRALPLAPGASYRFRARYAQTEYDAELRVTGRENVRTSIGNFNAVATQVRVRNNRRADDYRIRIFFSDDEHHIPVLMTARHPLGEIRIELASSELSEIPPPAEGGSAPALTPAATPTPMVTPTPATAPRVMPTPAPAPAGALRSPAAPLPFSVGEQLNFNFFLGDPPVAVGTGTFHARARANYFGRDGLLLASAIRTSGPGERLFPVENQINSYVDPATLLPFRTEVSLREGMRRETWIATYNQERGSVALNTGATVQIPVNTYDLVAVIYALRTFDLTPPRRIAVPLMVNQRPRSFSITAVGRETIEIGGQRISAIQLTLQTEGSSSDARNWRLWISDDNRRIPLRVTATTPLGLLRGDLAIIPVTRQ